MKKRHVYIGLIALMALLVLMACGAYADVKIVDCFPDPVFREVIRAYDTDGDGDLDDTEISNITRLELDWTGRY